MWKSEKERLEGKEKVLEYRLANSIEPLSETSREKMIMDSSGIGSIAVLLTVIVAAGIVASEFTQGTIKMLLSRPVKRWKILTSKYVTVILFGILLMLVGFIVSILGAFIFFQSGNGQELVWNGKEVVEVSVWGKGLYMLLLSFANVFVTATFAFMIGSVFRSSSLAIGLSLFIYFMGSTLVMLLAKYEIVKYIVFTHMDLTIYETDFRIVEGITMPFSLAVLAVYIVDLPCYQLYNIHKTRYNRITCKKPSDNGGLFACNYLWLLNVRTRPAILPTITNANNANMMYRNHIDYHSFYTINPVSIIPPLRLAGNVV